MPMPNGAQNNQGQQQQQAFQNSKPNPNAYNAYDDPTSTTAYGKIIKTNNNQIFNVNCLN
jgi:hypothetical protein